MLDVIIDKLLADATVSGLVGDRVAPYAYQGDALPYITLTVISNGTINHLGGATDTYQARIQIDCFGDSYGQTQSVVDAVVAELNGLRDLATTPKIQMVHLDDIQDAIDAPRDGAAIPRFVTSVDFLVDYSTT